MAYDIQAREASLSVFSSSEACHLTDVPTSHSVHTSHPTSKGLGYPREMDSIRSST